MIKTKQSVIATDKTMLSINRFLKKNGLVWHKYSNNKMNNKLKTLITNIQFLKGKKKKDGIGANFLTLSLS